jgi:NADPH2:quinone reductase
MREMTAQAVILEQPGGPNALRLRRIELPPPAAGEIRIRQTAIGVNYHDIYVRSGLYKTLPLPGIPGIEAVGVIEQLGADVSNFAVGDRIGYVTGAYGAYVEARNLHAALAIKLPPALEDAAAAASLMKALTVCMLVRRVHRVMRGDIILVHAAAGGVGQLLCHWASHLGATVIGTVGSVEKAALAKSAGAAHVILYREEDVAARVADITGKAGVTAAYDSVGADTFDASLASLGYEGHLISFGQSSGPIAAFAPSLLATRSLSLSRPIIFHYLRSPDRLRALADETLAAFATGILKPIVPTILPLAEVAEAHRQLEARQSPGGIVLTT